MLFLFCPISDDVQLYLADSARNNASSVAVVKQWENQLSEAEGEEMLDTQQLTVQRLVLHVPFIKTLFKSCSLDTAADVAPIMKKPRDDKQRQWVENKKLPWVYDGKPMQISKTQASVQHTGNKGKTPLRLPPTVIVANGYDNIEALPEPERRVQWQKLVGRIGNYAVVTLQTISLLLARVTPDAVVPKSKAKAWALVHEAVGLVAPPPPAPKPRKSRVVKEEVKSESGESKSKIDSDSKSESKAKVAGGEIVKPPPTADLAVKAKRNIASVVVGEETQPSKKNICNKNCK
jgi:hypothetical protein